MVERLSRNQQIAGSNPASGSVSKEVLRRSYLSTASLLRPDCFCYEVCFLNPDVEGGNPLTRVTYGARRFKAGRGAYQILKEGTPWKGSVVT